MGIQHGWPPVSGAELSLAEPYELRVLFSAPPGCFWGFQITFPPRTALAEQEQIWKVGVECALGGYSMQVQASGCV